MGSCRLCSGESPKNKRLDDRPFREKVLDIICMWIDVDDRHLSMNVCDSCFDIVEKFYLFKRKCRLFQTKDRDVNPLEEKTSIPEAVLNGEFEVIAENLKVPNEDSSEDENNSEDEYFKSLPPLKKKKKYPYKKSTKPPVLNENGERVIVPRPWARKFKEAVDLPPQEYREYVQTKKPPKKQNVVCEICGRTVDCCRIDGHRNRHLGLEPYECQICGDKFNCKYNLKSHHRRNHVEGQECPCSVCGKVFGSRPAMVSHMKNVHGERKYACTLCPLKFHNKKVFGSRPAMVAHTKSVHGERKHACTLCPLKFLNKTTLAYHLRIHNQTRDFKCPECGKGFYCKSVWNIHMRTHSGEAPYRCSVCEAAYVHRNMYVAHMKRNHPGVPLMVLSGKRAMKEALLKKGVEGVKV